MNMTSIIIYIAAAALIIYAIYGTVQKFRGKAKSSCCGEPETVTKAKVEDTDKSHYPYRYTLSIDGMMCSNCARTVEKALDEGNGVWARVNLGKHQADVLTKTPMDREEFESLLRQTSYTLTEYVPEIKG